MTDQQYAFQASRQFTDAVAERWAQVRAYKAAHSDPLQLVLDPHFPMYTHHILDVALDEHFVGFDDATDDVPAGLCRPRRGEYLLPARGKAGDVWRGHLETFNSCPRLTPVFSRYSVDTTILAVPRMVGVNLQYSEVTHELWLIYKGARPAASAHLLKREVSEFYAFDERVSAERHEAGRKLAERT
jgi:hypothetical protein